MSATNAPTPPIELPPGARLLEPREVAQRMGISTETATNLLAEGCLIAFTTRSAPAQVHISPAERYEVTAP